MNGFWILMYNHSIQNIVIIIIILVTIQLITMISSIVITERVLKERFDNLS